MNQTSYFIIIGPDADNDEQQYWDVKSQEWTLEYGMATRYDKDILCHPLSLKSIGIMEMISNYKPINFYTISSLPHIDPLI